jgi:hypothetical protein
MWDLEGRQAWLIVGREEEIKQCLLFSLTMPDSLEMSNVVISLPVYEFLRAWALVSYCI